MKSIQHYPADRTPLNNPNRERDPRDPFTLDNCEGYSQQEMDVLNQEFTHRWNNGEWETFDDARHAFQDEVARR